MNMITGLKVQFMSDHPEFGRLDSLDIYADEIRNGNTISVFNVWLLKRNFNFLSAVFGFVFKCVHILNKRVTRLFVSNRK